ncbi:PREDICTED: uncharacterized protein LOC104806048 [Tarenaya hassleriana]|uniref:uncharacterized protein LOC104806048 n=1 Tax=Tarenaya hassleriana TaxID=28532 RepID=UPI00053C757E|nr:PREDICTED: uncharacterized protein LOC104806048 [Tarenaya hassleriana]
MGELRRIMRAELEGINQRMDRMENRAHAAQNQPRQNAGRRVQNVPSDGEGALSDEEELVEQPQRPRRAQRARNHVDDDLGSIKMKIPSFQGRNDPEVYLEWERKTEMVFECHRYSELKKVKMAAAEFSDYALVWWDQLVITRRRNGEYPIITWDEMKAVMKRRFVPNHFHHDIHQRLRKLVQGNQSVEEYFKEMEILMIRADIEEDREATLQRFLGGLNQDIQDRVELGHFANKCPNRRVMVLRDDGEIETEAESDTESMPSLKDDFEEQLPAKGEALVIRRILNLKAKEEEVVQRENIFYTRCLIQNKVCSVIVDGGSCTNVASATMVEKLNLQPTKHPKPYRLQWLNDSGEVKVSKQVRVPFCIGKYEDEILCDVVPMQASHLLLGRPWQFDRRVQHDGYSNKYSFEFKGSKIRLVPLTPKEIYDDHIKQGKTQMRGSDVLSDHEVDHQNGEFLRKTQKQTFESKPERKQKNFFLRACEIKKALFSSQPIIVLLYKETLSNLNDFSSSLPSVLQDVLQEYKDVFSKDIPRGLPPIRGVHPAYQTDSHNRLWRLRIPRLLITALGLGRGSL